MLLKINTPTRAVVDRNGYAFVLRKGQRPADVVEMWDEDHPADAPHRAVQILVTEIDQ